MAVRSRLAAVDYAADGAFEERMYGVIEKAERNERVLVFVLDGLRRLLKAGEHGALAAGEMFAGVSVFADLRQHILHQAELIRHEWVR